MLMYSLEVQDLLATVSGTGKGEKRAPEACQPTMHATVTKLCPVPAQLGSRLRRARHLHQHAQQPGALTPHGNQC